MRFQAIRRSLRDDTLERFETEAWERFDVKGIDVSAVDYLVVETVSGPFIVKQRQGGDESILELRKQERVDLPPPKHFP